MQADSGGKAKTKAAAARSLTRWLTLGILCTGLALGCAQIRKATYPGDFVYLEQKQVTTEMAVLALYLRQLEDIMLDDSRVSSEQQQQIVSILARIDAAADRLGAGSIRTNHLVLDDHIDQFKSEVQLALANARADPPNYFALGRLSGACLGCHKHRRY